MLIDELHSKKEKIIAIASKYGAIEIQVFGSVARGDDKKSSDVDLLVSLPKGYDMFKQRIPMQEELQRVIGRPVDLVVKHEINKYLEADILTEARDL